MKSRNLKIISIISFVVLLIGSSFMSFATTIDESVKNSQNSQVPQKPENEIIGKITYIDATKVTISVAQRKEMEKMEKGQGGMPPEKPNNEMNDKMPPEKPNGEMNNGESLKKPNFDEMFTLTGESKTINIANADFGNKKNKKEDGQTENVETKKTYADYAIGDYIIIEATDSTYTVAKLVRGAHGMGGRKDLKKPLEQNNTNK